ncbi:hypothetical protein BVRB_1g014120 [Beta vulgaris subsp. vulgaris]|nr:hypothetical protein BVRB_1g014120 [Beta vulgaris subsp. vulgaris]
MQKSQKIFEAMEACSSVDSVPISRKLHAQMISTGLNSSIFLQNNLLHLYYNLRLVDDAFCVFSEVKFPNTFTWNTMINGFAQCRRIHDAAEVFNEMPQRDVVSWNSMMSGYFNNGRPGDSIMVFIALLQDCIISPGFFSFLCAMKACSSLKCLRLANQLHCLAVRHGLCNDTSVSASILDMYVKCGAIDYADQVFSGMLNASLFCWNSMIYGYSRSYGVESALDLFYRMPKRDDVSWSTIISLLSQHGFGAQTLNMFIDMCDQGFKLNSKTYASVIGACTSLQYLAWGCHLHARILRMETGLDVYTGSAFIHMYAKFGRLEYARRVFDGLAKCSVVSWTSLIGGYVQYNLKEKALTLFNKMRKIPLAPDEFTIATVIGACKSHEDRTLGLQLHAYIKKTGMDSSIPTGNALITMYSKVGNVQDAEIQFGLMPVKDIISWTAMITAFSHISDVVKSRECFDRMPERNVVSWNSMMQVYVQNGFCEEVFRLYILMIGNGIKLDSITFATSISACADYALLKLGTQIMAQAEKFGFGLHISVANSAITMYFKCGQITEAEKVFEALALKNVISWNSMLAGYAQNGRGKKVIEMFETMTMLNYAPDEISYVSLLTGCSHAGLVRAGCHYFNSMTQIHGICPTHEHYACMVDLLGRAGLVEQAFTFITQMPYNPTADIWGALLAACHSYRDTEVVEFALRELLELDVKGLGSYSLLANTYSELGKSEHVASVRKIMRETGIQNNRGCSWIEIHEKVNVFTANCCSHPQMADIHDMLESLSLIKYVKSNVNIEVLLDLEKEDNDFGLVASS